MTGAKKPPRLVTSRQGLAAVSALEMNRRQWRFVHEYVVDFNATRAATVAGYSPDSAASHGSKLLGQPQVQAAIAAAIADRAARQAVTQDRVLAELGRLAFSNVAELFDSGGHLRPVQDLPPGVAACISSVEVTTSRGEKGTISHVSKVKLWDKPAALGLLAKHLGLTPERILGFDRADGAAGGDAGGRPLYTVVISG